MGHLFNLYHVRSCACTACSHGQGLTGTSTALFSFGLAFAAALGGALCDLGSILFHPLAMVISFMINFHVLGHVLDLVISAAVISTCLVVFSATPVIASCLGGYPVLASCLVGRPVVEWIEEWVMGTCLWLLADEVR